MNTHYHFVGIGGIGMGAIASLLMDKGCTVSGSDVKENNITALLKNRGATIYIGHSRDNISSAQIIVVSSAINKDNPEVNAAIERNIPVIKRAKLLAELMKDQCGITIAGAHGKTTTTSMIAQLLIKAGLEPTTAVGGIIQGLTSNAQLGRGKYFVTEVDESDGSFLFFYPYFSIVTNMDREHLDYYKNWDNIVDTYKEFLKNTHPQGTIIACGEDKILLELLASHPGKYLTYGFSKAFNFSAQNIVIDKLKTVFDCYLDSDLLGAIEISIPGRHNVLNALACVALGQSMGIEFNHIQESLKSFKGVQRRFHQKGLVDGILVVDDYGHHPTEITATLAAAQKVKDKRLVVVFQPHRYSRLKYLMDDFAISLTDCDMLFLTDVYAASEEPIEGADSHILLEKIKSQSPLPVFHVKKEGILDALYEHLKAGDLVLTLGAGDITKISDQLVEKLEVEYLNKQKKLKV